MEVNSLNRFVSLALVALMVFVIGAAPALAEGDEEIVFTAKEIVDAGYDAYDAGDFEKARGLFELAAERGYAKAQNALGILYSNTDYAGLSYEKAVAFYQLAADQEYTGAQSNLAHMYYYGLGVETSYEKAAEYAQPAADKGDNYAQKLDGHAV